MIYAQFYVHYGKKLQLGNQPIVAVSAQTRHTALTYFYNKSLALEKLV